MQIMINTYGMPTGMFPQKRNRLSPLGIPFRVATQRARTRPGDSLGAYLEARELFAGWLLGETTPEGAGWEVAWTGLVRAQAGIDRLCRFAPESGFVIVPAPGGGSVVLAVGFEHPA